MSPLSPRVLRLDLPLDPLFDTAMAEGGATVTLLPPQGADEAIAAALATSFTYQVSSAKDELPERWQVRALLLAH